MNTVQLTQVARAKVAQEDSTRLRQLFDLQAQRELTLAEHDEAARLVEQEDLLTLRKAKAIFLLKQHNALPEDMAILLS